MTVESTGSKPELKASGAKVYETYPEQGKVRVLDVALDVLPLPNDVNARRFIPSKDILNTVCWDTPTVTLIRDMAIRLNGGISTRNEGPTGVSKSFAVEVLCAMTNRSYLRHNYSKEADIGDTIGRFVPSDERLSVRFEELLANKSLPQEEREMIEKARTESRSLTVYESKIIAKALGIDGLTEDTHWKWKNGSLTGSALYGTVFGADEPNLAPGNILERENSALEKRPSLRLVEHEGEVIRPLTPEEQSILDHGGVIPGVMGFDKKFWYVAAQNPYGIGGGRYEESEARRNRLQDRIVEGLTVKEYKEFLSYMVHGDQPDIVWQGRTYKGEKGLQTKYRAMENVPNVDILINWLAEFQTNLQDLSDLDKIGQEKDIRGGSYVYTRRNMERFMDSILGTMGSLLDVDETFTQKKPVYNTNWHDVIMEAVYQEYLAGLYRKDQDIVKDVIKASGIEDQIGESKNNPKPPKWVEQAGKKGIDVTRSGGAWQIR